MNTDVNDLLEVGSVEVQSTQNRDTNNEVKETESKLPFWIGIIFLIPPILGVLSFCLGLADVHTPFAKMSDLSSRWTGSSMSAAPIYLGLMAIAGAYLIKKK